MNSEKFLNRLPWIISAVSLVGIGLFGLHAQGKPTLAKSIANYYSTPTPDTSTSIPAAKTSQNITTMTPATTGTAAAPVQQTKRATRTS